MTDIQGHWQEADPEGHRSRNADSGLRGLAMDFIPDWDLRPGGSKPSSSSNQKVWEPLLSHL